MTAQPKVIISREPSRGYREEGRHRRCDLELETVPASNTKFQVFIRQSSEFIENFSIGLSYLFYGGIPDQIVLARYNGPHGEVSNHPDGHYAKPHIHRITAAEMSSGSTRPKARDREITNKYSIFGEALAVFFEDIGVRNHAAYFPELIQPRLFNGHQ